MQSVKAEKQSEPELFPKLSPNLYPKLMSPEIRISLRDVRNTLRLIGAKDPGADGKSFDLPGGTTIISGRVKGELLVIRQTALPGADEENTLFYNEKHVAALKSLGIVEFPKPKRRNKKLLE